MIYKSISLGNANLTAYIIDNSPQIEMSRKHPAVLILPGGGYEFTSDREAEPVALAFLAQGYNAFVLKYSAPAKYPTQLNEAEEAVVHIRENHDKYNTHPEKVAVIGFSAGGHLAATLAAAGKQRPDAAILCYPVITSGEHAHRGSFNVLGADISVEKCVTKEMPPTFIWHTQDDDCVPVENALLMASALRKYSVPFELHIFETGAHGLSMCNEQTANPNDAHYVNRHAANWFPLCIEWLNNLF